MYMKKYPCVYMRGGTSKAVIFHKEDLPADESKWDELFLKVMGSPDVKQIDGMGGTVSSTSKVAVITRSERPDADIDYTFFRWILPSPSSAGMPTAAIFLRLSVPMRSMKGLCRRLNL